MDNEEIKDDEEIDPELDGKKKGETPDEDLIDGEDVISTDDALDEEEEEEEEGDEFNDKDAM